MKTIQVAYYKEGKQWVAQALSVEISTFADTRAGAVEAIKEALELYFEDESGVFVPEIESVSVGPIHVQVA